MANAWYPKGIKHIMDGDVDLLVDNIKVMLVDSADETYNAADEFMADVTAAGRVGASANLANKTTGVVGTGVFDADDATWAAVTGDPCEAVIVYKDTGNVATDILLIYMDTFSSGFPFTPNGGGFTLQWAAGGIGSL